MCSSPFDCDLFGNGLLKLEDSRRGEGGGRVGLWDREIYIFVIQAEGNSYFGVSEKLLRGGQSRVKTTGNALFQLEWVSGD